MKYFKLFSLCLLTGMAMSCGKKCNSTPVDPANIAGTFKSPEVMMGRGFLYAWVKCEKNGQINSLGFTLANGATIVSTDDTIGHGMNMMHNFWTVNFPKQAEVTPFNHVGINFNPVGHLPGPYSFPHFDFHYYMITQAERLAIPEYATKDSVKFNNVPAADYLPLNYIKAPGGEPQMGAHWVNMFAPELNGLPFTETFVYGTYDGKVNFLEPMITVNFLKQNNIFIKAIPRPAKVQVTGYYPQKFVMEKKGADIVFSLEDMEYRIAQ